MLYAEVIVLEITIHCAKGEPCYINGVEATSELLHAVGNYLETCRRAEAMGRMWNGWIMEQEADIEDALRRARSDFQQTENDNGD